MSIVGLFAMLLLAAVRLTISPIDNPSRAHRDVSVWLLLTSPFLLIGSVILGASPDAAGLLSVYIVVCVAYFLRYNPDAFEHNEEQQS